MTAGGDATARAWALFDAVLDLAPAERAAFLARACGSDAATRAEVEALLAADAAPSALLDAPPYALAGALLPPSSPPAPEAPGRGVGPYRILRELGRGGMGVVYLAERTDVPLRVALKLVRGDLAAPEHAARFAVEQRVLARLAHPHVARLFDAGVAADGTPYVAMEYVDGVPIDAYCDAHRLAVDDRLALFAAVCDAVAYAHRSLVVHRDLKPTNVLVAADGTVKLLDFGIAKLLDDGPDAPDGVTRTGARLLTPEYAAPEQLRGDPVTTATDVYGLGVLLYELLAGRRPYRVTGRSLAEVERAVLRAEPPRLSVAVRRDADGDRAGDKGHGGTRASGRDGAPRRDADVVAAARRLTPERLARRLAGDLDTIVGKALDKAPERRYASAAELLDDLRRHQAGFPVRARPDSGAYRARAFVRRHRWAVATGAGLIALVTGTAAVTLVQQARTARALVIARAEADKSRQVTRLVATLLQEGDPYADGAAARTDPAAPPLEARGRPARETAALLERRAAVLERELAGQPAVRAELLRTLGVVERNLGRYDAAEALLRRGLTTREQLLGTRPGPDADLAGLLHELGVVRRARSDFAGADTLLAHALALREALLGEGDGADLAATRFELGVLRRLQGRYDEAERLLERAGAARRGAPGPTADVLEELANVRLMSGDAPGAAALERQVVAVRERWQGREHPAVARSSVRLAIMLRNAHRLGEAERAVRGALALQRERLPAGHPEVLAAESELSWVLMERGAYREAERVQRRVLAGRQRLYGDVHRDVAGSAYTLGRILYRRGAPAEAAGLLRRAVDTYTRVEGADHPETNGARAVLAVAEAVRGHEAEALAVTARLLRARRVPVWDETAQPLDALAMLLRDDGDCRHAQPLARRALAAYTARHPGLPADDVRLARLRDGVAACAPGRAPGDMAVSSADTAPPPTR